ncbi:MAG: UDP-N-acetylmuramoyl-L-alanyl-D-glutamate--2,6-diaminopimelate ligase [Prevotellaceae bacterium]|jgi:UDP-N-acetylmuramoyl-L-alanyl-D-glutamate--2,6-diaminopimelate ligase|nr:UDP-N-acetylmuramoyl-L-alanyl-D-glutamate--2,6-diaminopimelate ligase [Prevotellaceae bacterium]
MLLSQLTDNLQIPFSATADVEITDVTFDSRTVRHGSLFVAVRGTQSDGHQYIVSATEQGAAAVVCEYLPKEQKEGVIYLQVKESSHALGIIAANFYGNPSQQLKLVGVTGTNGKTTIATQLYKLFLSLGHRAGLLSTVCNYIDRSPVDATHTTPDALTINRLLADMVKAGCQYAFMEVSSHAVVQGRIDGLLFAGGIFTNLTRDHLDYHGTMAHYLKAKKRFFDILPASAFALVNYDDPNGSVMLQNSKATPKTYSIRTLADFKTKIIESSFEGTVLHINNQEITVPIVGKFNVSNLTAVYGAAVLLGKEAEEVFVALSTLKEVPGRFEIFRAPSGYTAIVDYAHTPDALTNVITAINDIRANQGQLITVVGCGGNRDRGKRPLMAKEAVRGSNRVILTSDNPRDENPQAILDDMLAGLDVVEQRKTLVIGDRREAIRTACALSQMNDVILIAGKGHETYQIVRGVKHHFDDREEVKKCLT